MTDLRVTRRAEIPDRFRVERCLRLPEFGPRLLFFSGGSALRKTSRVLKRYTHNSTHVITAFDSGGSSAELRRIFRMPSIGDLRNRLLALADESVQGNPEIYRLFSHRLPFDETPQALWDRLRALVDGTDPLVAELPPSMGRLVRTHLRAFAERATDTRFDLRGASIGNLVLAAGYLENDRHLDSVLFLFSKLVGVLGNVVPVTEEDAHLAAILEGGQRAVGQHTFRKLSGRIESLELVSSDDSSSAIEVDGNPKAIDAIREADLICYPMGSFYSSVIANLLPRGIRDAIAECQAPKVYVPNTGHDPEQGGRSAAECLDLLLGLNSASGGRPGVDLVLLHHDDVAYAVDPERKRIARSGVGLIELDLVSADSAAQIHPERLVEALVSLA
ncbi:MAG: GAK system CofD-like protein [Candidatus Eisenbacteria bacterium]